MPLVPRESWHDPCNRGTSRWASLVLGKQYEVFGREKSFEKEEEKKKFFFSWYIKDGGILDFGFVTENEYWFYMLWFWKLGLKDEWWTLKDWRKLRKWNSWKYCCRMDMECKLIKEIFGMKGESILRFILIMWMFCMKVILLNY